MTEVFLVKFKNDVKTLINHVFNTVPTGQGKSVKNICPLVSMAQFHSPSNLSLVVRKPVFGVSNLVPHKPGCAITGDG